MAEATPPGPTDAVDQAFSTARRQMRAPATAGVVGLAFAILFTGAVVLLRTLPLGGASDADIAAWFASGGDSQVVIGGLYLAPFSGIAFLWFVAVVRDQIGDREDRFFATVFLAGGILFVALLFAASATASTLVVGVRFLDQPPPTAAESDLLRALAYTLMFGFASRAAALFMLSTATVGLRTGAFPRWFALVGYVVGIALLVTVSFFDWIILALPAWVAFVSVVILVRERARHPGEVTPVPPGHPTD
ncbi:MAG TPA: hypothetical protein VEG29_00110 [Candidatus Binatia bacterium]|nr:hypothetical protein [Candidatus Binatia bacterium]